MTLDPFLLFSSYNKKRDTHSSITRFSRNPVPPPDLSGGGRGESGDYGTVGEVDHAWLHSQAPPSERPNMSPEANEPWHRTSAKACC